MEYTVKLRAGLPEENHDLLTLKEQESEQKNQRLFNSHEKKMRSI